MTTGKSLLTGILILCLAGFAGCCAVPGNGGKTEVQVKSSGSQATTGQQLIDLKKALDKGAITQEEYDKKRQEILEKNE